MSGARRADAGTGGLVLKPASEISTFLRSISGQNVEDVDMILRLVRDGMDALIDEDSGMSVAEAVEHGISGISCEISESTRREMEEYGRYMKSASKILRGLVEGDTP